MKLIVTLIDSTAGRKALDSAVGQGLPAVLVWSEAAALFGGRVTLLIGAHDQDAPEVAATVASLAAVTDTTAQALLPLADPTDLHVGRPPTPGISDAGIYVLRVSRFEQIW